MGEQNLIINVYDYSINPGPRYCSQGDDSGEDFYHKILNNEFTKAYNSNQKLILNLDGPDGYASSFLDEAIGNLVFDFSKEVVKKNMTIQSIEEPEWIDMIENETYIQWEDRRVNKNTPNKTEEHSAWSRLNSDTKQIESDIWIKPN